MRKSGGASIFGSNGKVDEAEMYRLDVGTRPDEADEDAYERMPIEMFGKAYLRGYDWKDGDGMGTLKPVDTAVALASGSTTRLLLPQPKARALPLVLGSAPSPFEATRQPSSGPRKAADLRSDPRTGAGAAAQARLHRPVLERDGPDRRRPDGAPTQPGKAWP